jgi:hypothetical protein
MNKCTNNESDTKYKSRQIKITLSISYLYCQRMPRCSVNPFKTIITPRLVFIEVNIPSKNNDRECIRLLEKSVCLHSVVFKLDF